MLCTQVLNGLIDARSALLSFDVGREFDVVAVSINPKESPGLAAQKKAAYMERYDRPHTAGGLALPDRHGGIDPRSSPTRSASATPTTRRSSSTRTAPRIEVLTPRGSSRTTSTASSSRRATSGSG